MTTITIKNCNNVKSANISLIENAINIKYGYNGTGKTTISKAIQCKVESNVEDLKKLTTFGSDMNPEVSDISFHKVKVFNEDYINHYLFQEDHILKDSYQVLLRSPDCEELMQEIDEMLHSLQDTFVKQDSISNLQVFLNSYLISVHYDEGKINKRGGVNEFIKGNGAGFDKHLELQRYRPYYQQDDFVKVTDWASWRTKGIKIMKDKSVCPFCADKLRLAEVNTQNKTIEKVFKSSALKTGLRLYNGVN